MGRMWFPYDFPAGYYATVAYWITSLQAGEWPQWVPYQSMGYPLLMNPQSGFFYPPFWLFVLLRIPFTIHAAVIVQILHVLFGAVGFLLLANVLFRSLLAAECGAIAFLLFGGFYTNAEHADIIRGFAWVPWLLWAALRVEERWEWRNLLLPMAVACFITGAYTGQVFAGLFLLAIFVACRARRSDVLRQYGLIAVGLLMAGAFLLTAGALANGLTRTRDVHLLSLMWLTGKTIFDLVFPSRMAHPLEDISMLGMQLPALLFLFMPLIDWKLFKKATPFVVVAALAALMSFKVFAPFSMLVRRVIPPLGFSRFPTADYREWVYLGVLVLATGGIASVLRKRPEVWRAVAVAAVFALVCLSGLQHTIAPASTKDFLVLAKLDLAAMLAICGLLLVPKPAIAVYALMPLMVFVSWPVTQSQKQFWQDPDLMKNVYDGHGFPLEVHGRMRTANIFERHETQRAPRVFGDNIHMLSWWGYLDGAYLTNDAGGVVPLTRDAAERNPALLQFVLEGSRIIAVPCEGSLCDQPDPTVDVLNKPAAGSAVSYSRNSVTYDVDLPVRSLVVENEMGIPGWHVEADGKSLPMRVVDGSLRGWVAPAGRYRVTLRYRTPVLIPGMLVSVAGFLTWMALLWRFHHTRTAQNTAEDCVILVSSDRTGG